MADYFFGIDWRETFVPHLTLPELLVRATSVYFTLLLLKRSPTTD